MVRVFGRRSLWNAFFLVSLIAIVRWRIDADLSTYGNNKIPRLPPEEARALPRAIFVFFAGLEGTGHHLLTEMYKNSSSLFRFYRINQNLKRQMAGIGRLLDNKHNPESALFTAAHAAMDGNGNEANGAQIFNHLVSSLQESYGTAIDILERDVATTNVPLAIPLNLFLDRSGTGSSYPTGSREPRGLRFPDLHLIYRACRKAAVPCGHVYMHRDPYSVLRSTTINRQFSLRDAQIKLLVSMQSVLRVALQDFPEQLLSCFNYDGVYDKTATVEQPYLTKEFSALLQFLGVPNEAFMRLFVDSSGDKPSHVEPKSQVFMDTLVDLSSSTIRLCEEIQKSTQRWVLPPSSQTAS